MEWLKKNWMVLGLGVFLVFALTGNGIQSFRASRIGNNLRDATERIVELEGSLAKSEEYVGELEDITGSLREDSKRFRERYESLNISYQTFRRNSIELTIGTDALQNSNSTSLDLVGRGIEIVRQLSKND